MLRFILFSLFLFLHVCIHAQPIKPGIPQRMQIKQIYPKTKTVEKLEKLELGVDIPNVLVDKINNFLFEKPVDDTQKLNPFLEWELSVKAYFTHHESGRVIERDGFYYRELKRDVRADTWRDQQNDFPMRIRFAPDEIGTWSVEMIILERERQNAQSIRFGFEVVESDRPGYVSVNDRGDYLEREGTTIFPTGFNHPGPYVANNILYSHTKDAKLNLEAWTLFQSDIKRYALEGGKHFRFFMSPSATDIEFEKLGNYYDRLNFAWEIDKMLETCETHDVLVDFNMLIHTPIMVMGDYYQFRYDYADFWHDESVWPHKDKNYPYAYSAAFNSKTPSDMFLNEEPMKYIKQRIKYIIARWGYSTAISLFELLSEPWHINEHWINKETPYDSISSLGDSSRKAVYNYHKEIGSYIKNDLKHENHLLGAVGRFPLGSDNDRIFSHRTIPNGYNDSTWFDPNIDVVSISFYSSVPDKMIITKKGKKNTDCEDGENSYSCTIERLQKTYGKPILFGESDHGDGTNTCSELQGHAIDLMRVNISGAAGHYIWAAFMYPYKGNNEPIDQRESWKYVVAASDFFNKPFVKSVIDSLGVQGRQRERIRGEKEYLKEHQYILSASQKKGFGYIYNRTFNVATAIGMQDSLNAGDRCYLENSTFMQPLEIQWKPKRLKVDGLTARKSYLVRYYGFATGTFLTAIKTKATIFGKINLEHPPLGYTKETNPLIWYEIEQLDY